MKILYALNEREDNKISLLRFLNAVKHKNYNIKIAAYDKSSPNISIDWNLEALKYIYDASFSLFDNENLENYYEYIKYFDPDLIISDLEIFTSHIASLLNKPIWQVSPNLLHFATPQKEKMAVGFFKYYPHFFKDLEFNQRIKNLIENSKKNLVYSHFCDANKFQIEDKFEWVRPYYVSGKTSIPCIHNIVGAVYRNNKNLINYMNKYKDGVLFSLFTDENYKDIIVKDINDPIEYACNLKNSHFVLNQGYTSFLADAFYNGKHCLLMPNYNEQEAAQNAMYTIHFKLGDFATADVIEEPGEIQMPQLNKDVKFLHEHLETL